MVETGIDSLDAAWLLLEMLGVFANFETLSLDAATVQDLDIDLLNKINSLASS